MLIDTHCHIHDPEYNFDAAKTIARAHANQVDKIIVIGTSPADSLTARAFAAAHPEAYWSYGTHPEAVASKIPNTPPTSQIFSDKKLVAIGEIGLDYHYEPLDKKAQITLFEQMLELAASTNLPIIFHVREAYQDFWPIIGNAKIKNAVLHSFSDNAKNLEIALNHNFYIGVNGLATFAPIPLPPLDKMLLETDAPFLTPIPFRGKINEPAYVKNIAEWIANKLGTTLEQVATTTTANAHQLFKV